MKKDKNPVITDLFKNLSQFWDVAIDSISRVEKQYFKKKSKTMASRVQNHVEYWLIDFFPPMFTFLSSYWKQKFVIMGKMENTHFSFGRIWWFYVWLSGCNWQKGWRQKMRKHWSMKGLCCTQLQWAAFSSLYVFCNIWKRKRGCSVHTGSISASESDWHCFSKTLEK